MRSHRLSSELKSLEKVQSQQYELVKWFSKNMHFGHFESVMVSPIFNSVRTATFFESRGLVPL